MYTDGPNGPPQQMMDKEVHPMKSHMKWFPILVLLVFLVGLAGTADAHWRLFGHRHRCHSHCWCRSYVVPTWYGYGMVHGGYGWLAPYIVNPVPAGYAAGPYATYSPYVGAGMYGYAGGYYPAGYRYGSGYGNGWTLGWVDTNGLNIRSGPGSGYGVVSRFAYGEQLWIGGRSGDWYYVQAADGSARRGYVHGGYLKLAPNNGAYWPYRSTAVSWYGYPYRPW